MEIKNYIKTVFLKSWGRDENGTVHKKLTSRKVGAVMEIRIYIKSTVWKSWGRNGNENVHNVACFRKVGAAMEMNATVISQAITFFGNVEGV